jgi:hypothetical protein
MRSVSFWNKPFDQALSYVRERGIDMKVWGRVGLESIEQGGTLKGRRLPIA